MKSILTAKYAFALILAFGMFSSLTAQSPQEQAVMNAEMAIGNICEMVYAKAITMPTDGSPCDINTNQSCISTGCYPYSNSQLFPLTVYISIPDNCQYITHRGDTIKGKIEMTFSGTVAQTGTANVSVVLTNVRINSLKIAGNLSMTVNKNSTVQPFSLTAKSTNLAVTSPKGASLTFSDLTYTATQVGGQSSQLASQDSRIKYEPQTPSSNNSFDITINGKAKDENDRTVLIATTSALHRLNSCEWPVSGMLECTTGAVITKINYGNGTCDNLVAVTVGGVTKTVPLP